MKSSCGCIGHPRKLHLKHKCGQGSRVAPITRHRGEDAFTSYIHARQHMLATLDDPHCRHIPPMKVKGTRACSGLVSKGDLLFLCQVPLPSDRGIFRAFQSSQIVISGCIKIPFGLKLGNFNPTAEWQRRENWRRHVALCLTGVPCARKIITSRRRLLHSCRARKVSHLSFTSVATI